MARRHGDNLTHQIIPANGSFRPCRPVGLLALEVSSFIFCSRLRLARAAETAKNHFSPCSFAHGVRLRSSAFRSRKEKDSFHFLKSLLVSVIAPLSNSYLSVVSCETFSRERSDVSSSFPFPSFPFPSNREGSGSGVVVLCDVPRPSADKD